jgi:hypothetical protein
MGEGVPTSWEAEMRSRIVGSGLGISVVHVPQERYAQIYPFRMSMCYGERGSGS